MTPYKSLIHLFQQCRGFSLRRQAIVPAFNSNRGIFNSFFRDEFRFQTTKVLVSSCSTKSQDGKSLLDSIECLSVETNRLLNSKVKSSEITSLIDRWNSLSEIINIPTRTRRSSRRSNFKIFTFNAKESSRMKLLCTERMHEILQHLMAFHTSSSDKSSNTNLKSFLQVMIAWKDSGSPEAGFRCAEILEQWGQLFGGNIELAPSIQEFNLVLEAHSKAAAGDYDSFIKDEESCSPTTNTSYPAEVAYDIYVFLSNMRDIALLPNILTCSHTIHALTNHAFVMKYAKKDLRMSMPPEVAAIRAYSIWKKMIDMMSRVDCNSQDINLIWRAHADIISLSSQGMVLRHDHEGVQHLGKDTQELLEKVLQSSDIPYANADLMEYVQDIYYFTMNGWLIEQELAMRQENSLGDNYDSVCSEIMNAASHIHSLIESMKEKDIQLLDIHYDVLIQAHSNLVKLNEGNLGKLIEILDEIEDRFMDVSFDDRPNFKIQTESFKTAIDTVLPFDIEKAEDLFHLMVEMYSKNKLSVKKNGQDSHILGYSLNAIILQHLKKNAVDFGSLNRVKFLIDQLQRATKHLQHQPHWNSVAYGSYLNLALKFGPTEDAVKMVLEAFDDMTKKKLNPTTSTYITAIKVLCGEGNQELLDKAKSLLSSSIKNFNDLPIDVKVSYDFNATALYSTFISARNKSRPKPQEALHLLRGLQKAHESYKDDRLKPDIFLYSNVLSSFAWQKKKSDSNRWAEESLKLVSEVESLCRDDQHDNMKPNKVLYTHVLSALSKSSLPDISFHVKDILKRITDRYDQYGTEDLKPDFKLYEAALNALRRSDNPDMTVMEDLVTSIEQLAKQQPNLFPIGKFYQSLLSSITHQRDSNQDIGLKAEEVLRRMYTLYDNGNWDVKPTADDFHKVLQSWSSSKHPKKALKALELSEEMEERYNKGDISVKPSCKTFTLVLNSCFLVHHDDFKREDIIRVALQVKDHFLKHQDIYGPADPLFFVVLIKIFGFCIKDEIQKRRFLAILFEDCCKEGLVNNQVIESLKRFDLQLCHSLENTSSIPSEWSSRCKQDS